MLNSELNLDELNGLSPEEKEVALKILSEYSDKGSSETYNQILTDDYEEFPVDISTFLHDRKYLGNALYDGEGRFTLFPYWEDKLKEIFPTSTTTAYNTVILTGSIGIGKTLCSVVCMLYMLYRLLCLKDPYLYYGLQPIDKISIAFVNISLEASRGVGMDKLNQMILASPWFMSHGTMAGITNLEYRPDKHVELIAASSNNQIIGRALFCLDGETYIKTDTGDFKLKDLVNKEIRVASLEGDGNECMSDTCTVVPTVVSNEEYQIELEDGTLIKCTPNHRFLLKDGTYKEAQYLTEDDELEDVI